MQQRHAKTEKKRLHTSANDPPPSKDFFLMVFLLTP